MDSSKIVFAVMGLLAALVVVATLAIPVIQESSIDYEKIEQPDNAGTVFYDVNSGHEASWTGTEFTVDGQAITPTARHVVLASKNVSVLFINGSAALNISNGDGSVTTKLIGDSWTLSITSAGALTVTGTETTNVDVEGDFIFNVANGDYVLSAAGPINANNGSKVFMFGIRNDVVFGSTTKASSGTMTGSINGESTIISWDASTELGVSTISGFSYTEDGENTLVATAVPVSYYKLEPTESFMAPLLSVVGTLLVISVLMIAVRMIAGRD